MISADFHVLLHVPVFGCRSCLCRCLQESAGNHLLHLVPLSVCPEALPLQTLTSLNKEVRLFLLGDNDIGSFLSVSSLSRLQHLEGSLAIIAFGALQFIVPKYHDRLGKIWKLRSLASLFTIGDKTITYLTFISDELF